MSDKVSGWTDEERDAIAKQRDADNDDAYERVKVKDCQVCAPEPCKSHRLLVKHPSFTMKVVLK